MTVSNLSSSSVSSYLAAISLKFSWSWFFSDWRNSCSLCRSALSLATVFTSSWLSWSLSDYSSFSISSFSNAWVFDFEMLLQLFISFIIFLVSLSYSFILKDCSCLSWDAWIFSFRFSWISASFSQVLESSSFFNGMVLFLCNSILLFFKFVSKNS